MNNLNLGCGYVNKAGWLHVDIKDYGTNTVADVRDRLPFDDNVFDFILMNHTLQMFTYEELPIVLKEVRRVMKEGATLRILVPDFPKAIVKWQEGDRDYFPISDDIEPTISGKCLRYIYWHGDTRSGFNSPALADLLERNGFYVIKYKAKFGECELDSREEESLIMEATK